MDKYNFLKLALEPLSIALKEEQYEQLIDYYELLIQWNEVMNLTAITAYEEVVVKHFLDSLSLIRVCDLSGSIRLLDMGSGAGFPGIPLKIAFPQLEIVLLDSLNKRVKFLNEVIERLGLTNIRAVHGRAEDYGRREEFRETFDICVSRAVSRLTVLSEYCIPFIKVGGFFISYKSGHVEEETEEARKAVKILGAGMERAEKFLLPGTLTERTLVVIKKNMKTIAQYPRSAGRPGKEPLGMI